eukprot:GHVS01106009.1.p1 GENE.GHVS01106009.1~~GHVS01106009.1.p1  ORF type:complete len:293 (+),score=20.35 GHVS01106009.1:1014-1892(+)
MRPADSSDSCQDNKGVGQPETSGACPTVTSRGNKAAKMDEHIREGGVPEVQAGNLGQLAAAVQKGTETKFSVVTLLDKSECGSKMEILMDLDHFPPSKFSGSFKQNESAKDDQPVELQFEFVAKTNWQLPQNWIKGVGHVFASSPFNMATYQLFLPLTDTRRIEVELESFSSKLVYRAIATNDHFRGFNARFVITSVFSPTNYNIELIYFTSPQRGRLIGFEEWLSPIENGNLVKIALQLPECPKFQKLRTEMVSYGHAAKNCKIQWHYEHLTNPLLNTQNFSMFFIIKAEN